MVSNIFARSTAQLFTAASMALIAVAVQAQPDVMRHPSPKKGGMSAQNDMSSSGMDMSSMMASMKEKMAQMKSSGDVDVDFAMMMRMHHQSAINMANVELQTGKDPRMRVLAKDITYTQKKALAVIDMFLAKRGEAGMTMSDTGMKMSN